jgi:hypothetical protein
MNGSMTVVYVKGIYTNTLSLVLLVENSEIHRVCVFFFLFL